eukprot:TRINITY_DN993_c0_g1_i1.p2 TRINITY_DN993_c0_g1~~TRINITY_DN993_c0_g1_i1.p2  ORF type:complete len:590 (-),score=125.60 TRINITY_DN993_c0_g1_i1:81-1850(-)
MVDEQSSIVEYRWAVGHGPGREDIQAFQDVGDSLTHTFTFAQAPEVGRGYWFSAKAINGVGLSTSVYEKEIFELEGLTPLTASSGSNIVQFVVDMLAATVTIPVQSDLSEWTAAYRLILDEGGRRDEMPRAPSGWSLVGDTRFSLVLRNSMGLDVLQEPEGSPIGITLQYGLVHLEEEGTLKLFRRIDGDWTVAGEECSSGSSVMEDDPEASSYTVNVCLLGEFSVMKEDDPVAESSSSGGNTGAAVGGSLAAVVVVAVALFAFYRIQKKRGKEFHWSGRWKNALRIPSRLMQPTGSQKALAVGGAAQEEGKGVAEIPPREPSTTSERPPSVGFAPSPVPDASALLSPKPSRLAFISGLFTRLHRNKETPSEGTPIPKPHWAKSAAPSADLQKRWPPPSASSTPKPSPLSPSSSTVAPAAGAGVGVTFPPLPAAPPVSSPPSVPPSAPPPPVPSTSSLRKNEHETTTTLWNRIFSREQHKDIPDSPSKISGKPPVSHSVEKPQKEIKSPASPAPIAPVARPAWLGNAGTKASSSSRTDAPTTFASPMASSTTASAPPAPPALPPFLRSPGPPSETSGVSAFEAARSRFK